MTLLKQTSINRVQKINWFSSIGNTITGLNENIKQITLESVAADSLTSLEWENTTLEASNNLSSFLANNHSDSYQLWNILIEEANLLINNNILDTLPILNGFNNSELKKCISWDIRCFLLEDFYNSNLAFKNNLFFNKLMMIYESGHIPCGWIDGIWPQGSLVIY